jgi:hypothetical protein
VFWRGQQKPTPRLVPMQYIYYPSTRPRFYETTRLRCRRQITLSTLTCRSLRGHCMPSVEPRSFAANKSPLNSFVREYPHKLLRWSESRATGTSESDASLRKTFFAGPRPTSTMVAKARCWVVRLAASNPPLSTLATSPWRECSGPSDQVRKILESSAALRVNQHLRN